MCQSISCAWRKNEGKFWGKFGWPGFLWWSVDGPIFCLQRPVSRTQGISWSETSWARLWARWGDFPKCFKNSNEKKHFEGLKEHGSFILYIYIYPGFSLPKKSLTTINSGKADVPRILKNEAKGDSENANNATMQMIRFALEEWAAKAFGMELVHEIQQLKFAFKDWKKGQLPKSKLGALTKSWHLTVHLFKLPKIWETTLGNHRFFSLNGTGMTEKVCSANTHDTFWYTKIVTEIPLVS